MSDALQAQAVALYAPAPISAVLRAPASKSMTNRALLLAALADGVSTLHAPLDSRDTDAMVRVALGLGAEVADDDGVLTVTGTGGRLRLAGGEINVALSGTSMRFGAAAAAVAEAPVTLTGHPPLLKRPIGPLAEALRALGATVIDQDGRPPVTVRGPLLGGNVVVDVVGSSQFLSAVLMAAPYAQHPVTAVGTGAAAHAYIEMTAALMRRWGAEVANDNGTWHVATGGYAPRNEQIEYDASAAAHLYTLAATTGGSITVTNATLATLQPDAGILDVFSAMGCSVTRDEDIVTVEGPERLVATEVDLHAMPDQLPTVAVLGALADGETRITGAAVTRGHETDRITACATELRKLGVEVEEQPDGLSIRGGNALGPASLATYNDHRLAMAFAALALAVDGITIEDPGCVAKTYPRFWDDVAAAGALVHPVG